jgi:hypothetical protein
MPPMYARVDDGAQSGQYFEKCLGPPSKREAALKALHEEVYHARGEVKYLAQKGLCAHCKRPLRGQGDTDHIKSRGRNGRDDRLENLQVLCSAFSGGCDFHRKKHGG